MKQWSTIAKVLQTQGRCALVTVAATKGSAPRGTDAWMVVTPLGYHGTIGGGTLEWRAIAAAQAQLNAGPQRKRTFYALGPDLGQCCGGQVELVTELYAEDELDAVRVRADREAEQPFEGQRTVIVLGAGHVGRALVLALAPLPFRVLWVDPRPEAFPAMMPANATALATDPLANIAAATEGTLLFIMSHSHALDLAVTDAALRNSNIAEVGLIGSATKRARFEKRLREANVPESRISGLICPIGVAEIASKLPAAIAAATVAQILVLDQRLSLATEASAPQNSIPMRGMAG
jgi:xanthine dehydrogenase accessory factor